MRSRILFVALVVITGGIQMSGQREPGPGRYIATDATIEPLSKAVPGGNAVLRVRFEQGRTPPPRIVYQTEGGTVVLADDGKGFDAKAGDGLYTALGNINLVAFRERLLQLSRSKTALPTRAYRGRSKQTLDARSIPGCGSRAASSGSSRGGSRQTSTRAVPCSCAPRPSSRTRRGPGARAARRRWACGASAI